MFGDLEALDLYGLNPEMLPVFRYDYVGQLTLARKAHPEKFPPTQAGALAPTPQPAPGHTPAPPPPVQVAPQKPPQRGALATVITAESTHVQRTSL